MQLVEDFTTEHDQDEVEFYMDMVAEEDQSVKGLVEHLCNAFQSGKTLSQLISAFYGQSQKTKETEDTFADYLQVLARKNILWKPSFWLEANQPFKAQCMYKLWDSYYAATAPQHITIFPRGETFMRLWGCLLTMFGGCVKQNKSSVISTGIDAEVSQIRDSESKLSKTYCKRIGKYIGNKTSLIAITFLNPQRSRVFIKITT